MLARVLIGLALLLVSLTLPSHANDDLACRDEDGNAVDWYIGYKFPKILDSDGLFLSGEAYAYLTNEDAHNEDYLGELPYLNRRYVDSDSKVFLYKFKDLLLHYLGHYNRRRSFRQRNKGHSDEEGWVVAEQSISEPGSVLMRTLEVVYNPKQGRSVSSVFYNDDPTGTSIYDDLDVAHNRQRAHAKGVLLMDEQSNSGVWLTHSIPKFPTVRSEKLQFSSSGYLNGQTFMCISFHLDKAGRELVDHLVNMRPLVYDVHVSENLYKMFPNLNYLQLEEKIKGARIPVQPKLGQFITTKNGQVVHLFSKSISFDADIYSNWINEDLRSDLLAETWLMGNGGPMDSYCPSNDYHVTNIRELQYDSSKKWPHTKDHSKWAISESDDIGIVCIGDSNRMNSQSKRGGGAVCIRCKTCWSVFRKTIEGLEACPMRKRNLDDQAGRSAVRNIMDVLCVRCK